MMEVSEELDSSAILNLLSMYLSINENVTSLVGIGGLNFVEFLAEVIYFSSSNAFFFHMVVRSLDFTF